MARSTAHRAGEMNAIKMVGIAQSAGRRLAAGLHGPGGLTRRSRPSLFGSPPKVRNGTTQPRTATMRPKRQPVATNCAWSSGGRAGGCPCVRASPESGGTRSLTFHARDDAVAYASIEIDQRHSCIRCQSPDEVGIARVTASHVGASRHLCVNSRRSASIGSIRAARRANFTGIGSLRSAIRRSIVARPRPVLVTSNAIRRNCMPSDSEGATCTSNTLRRPRGPHLGEAGTSMADVFVPGRSDRVPTEFAKCVQTPRCMRRRGTSCRFVETWRTRRPAKEEVASASMR